MLRCGALTLLALLFSACGARSSLITWDASAVHTACDAGAHRRCYDGPPGTAGVGLCTAGTQQCVALGDGGFGWSSCAGEVLPQSGICDGLNHRCAAGGDPACACTLGATEDCYDGPPGTEGVGLCLGGLRSCVPNANGQGAHWSDRCDDEILPGPPRCDGFDHACTGQVPDCDLHVICPPPAATHLGVSVSVDGRAVPPAGAMVTNESWAVIASPDGARYTLSGGNPASFTPFGDGLYTLEYTATDSTGQSASCDVHVTTAPSYLGTEFFAISTVNRFLPPSAFSGEFDYAIAIGNPNHDPVMVTVSGGALTMNDTFEVPPDSTVTHVLPWESNLARRSDSVLEPGGAYIVQATSPVSAYQFNPLEYQNDLGTEYSRSNGASLLLPTDTLTGRYIVLAHQAWSSAGSYVTIAGTQPGTTDVAVTLTAPVQAGGGVTAAASGTTQHYMLQRGDVVQLISTHDDGMSYGSEDLTGTVIEASAPVAVFAGTECTYISTGGTCRACDHLEQQLFPFETWGRDVVVSQLVDRGQPDEPFFVRILSREDGNTITFTPASVHPTMTLDRSGFLEFCAQQDFEISATEPILVEQYMVGQGVTGCNLCTGGDELVGDPDSVLEVPTTQYRHDYNFVVPGTYISNFVNIVGTSDATIDLDGAPIGPPTATIAGTNWAVWRISVFEGSHTARTMDPTGFGLKVLGVATYTSYAYPGGLDLGTL